MAETLKMIIEEQDQKINTYLQTKQKTDFFYAYSPHSCSTEEYLDKVHAAGFDNYPLAPVNEGLFLVERLIGCKTCTVDNQTGSFFHTWCEPIIHTPDDIFKLRVNLDNNAVWNEYLKSVSDYYESTGSEMLPLAFPGLNLFDAACNACGAQHMLELIYEDADAVGYLLDIITDTQIQVYRRLRSNGVKLRNSYGFPCLYCNDLQMGVISPSMIEEFLLPRYFRVAEAVGGMFLVLNCPDVTLAEFVLKQDFIVGCGFDKRISLDDIDRILGDKLFVIYNGVYNPDIDHPMEIDGIWCNPIVQAYSKELMDVYHRLHNRHSFLITIERYTIDAVSTSRKELFTNG